MKNKEMDKLMQHFNHYFKQSQCTVLHPIVVTDVHIDVLVYKPNKAFPYWKLVTMGASDYPMPHRDHTLGHRNEYVMFVDPSEDLTDQETVAWYHQKLMTVALYPRLTKTHLTYGHSMEWEPEEGEEMVGAFLEMPQLVEDPAVLRCKLGWVKTTVCLQVVLLNRAELEQLFKLGPEQFSNYLYPDDGGVRHFLCERQRSERF